MKAVKGDLSKKDAMRKAIEKANFKSVRGNFKFGTNHIPIQNFYLQEVVKEGDDYRLKTVATIVENDQDKHARQVHDAEVIGRMTASTGRQKRALLPSCYFAGRRGLIACAEQLDDAGG